MIAPAFYRRCILATTLFFLCGPLWLPAQVVWQNADSAFGVLPKGVGIFKTTTQLDGKPNIAYYVSIELKNAALRFTTQVGEGKRYTPTQYYQKEDSPFLVVNGTFFSFADNRNLNLVVRNGKMAAYNQPVQPKGKDSIHYYYLTRSAIGINRKGKADIAWLYTDTASSYPMALRRPSTGIGSNSDPAWKDLRNAQTGINGRKWKMETAIGGGPVLVQNNQKQLYHIQERMFVNGENDKHPRTAMGYTNDGRLIILVVEGRNLGVAEGASLHQLANMMVAIGCKEALNLDGGGSSCMLINGIQTIKPSDKEGQRAVPAVFMVYAQN